MLPLRLERLVVPYLQLVVLLRRPLVRLERARSMLLFFEISRSDGCNGCLGGSWRSLSWQYVTSGTDTATHTTLTPLTPLKRTARNKSSSSLSQDGSESAHLPPSSSKTKSASKLASLRNSSSQKSGNLKNGIYGTMPPSPSSSVSSASAVAKLSHSKQRL